MVIWEGNPKVLGGLKALETVSGFRMFYRVPSRRAHRRCPAPNVFGASGSQIESFHQNLDSGTACGPDVEAHHPT